MYSPGDLGTVPALSAVSFASSPLKIQEVSLFVELNSEGFVVGKS